ncbi:MAG TPA: TIGR00730 family Rossman fold protein [Micromonosporaceae bacterium]
MAAICVFCASSGTVDPRWTGLAAEVGLALAARGHSLVSGGGQVGMMGAVCRGARAGGAPTFGVIPEALMALEVADRDSDDLVVTRDMAERKTVMMDKADGFLVLPGGIGTLDELFEVWTTAALGMHRKPVVLLNVDDFYTGLLQWLKQLALAGFVRPPALDMLVIADSVAVALDAFEQEPDWTT